MNAEGSIEESKTARKRKRRSDRNHVVYRITCIPTGDTYIGITVVRGRAFKKSLRMRFDGHVYHAKIEKRPYALHKAIRKHGADAFKHEIIEIVRGKAAAHAREVELIHEQVPALNVEATKRKRRSKKREKKNVE